MLLSSACRGSVVEGREVLGLDDLEPLLFLKGGIEADVLG